MTIGERMKQCRKRLKMSAAELGKRIGKDRSTIFRYEKGEIDKMPVDILKPIAEALQTTPAYLMGWEEEPKLTEKDKNELTIGDVIRTLRIDRKLSLAEFSSELGIPVEELRKYENGSKQLSAHSIAVIAHLFGLEATDITDMLMYSEEEKKPMNMSRDYIEQVKNWNKEFGYEAFTHEEQEQLFNFARFLISNRKK